MGLIPVYCTLPRAILLTLLLFDSGIFSRRKLWQVFFWWLDSSRSPWWGIKIIWRFMVPAHPGPVGLLQSHNNSHGGLILPGTLRLSYTVLCGLREPATKFSATIFRSLVLYQRSLTPPWQENCAFGLKENLHFCIKHLFEHLSFKTLVCCRVSPRLPPSRSFRDLPLTFHLYALSGIE